MADRGYLTPDSVPDDSQCRVLRIPNSTAWLSVFMGALLPLASSESWQKSGTLTTQESADVALDVIWNAYSTANQECPLDVRQNEETPCLLEKSFDGGETWEEFADLQLCPPLVVIGADGTPYVSDDGGETYHSAPVEAQPRTPVEGQDSKCLAAANGAAVMAAFYAQVQAYFDGPVLLLVALGGIIALILALLGLPLAIGAAVEAFTALWGLLSGFVADDFDSDKEDIYRCILFCHSTLTDDVVTFDYDAILGDVDELWGPIETNVWTAVHYLLLIISSDGVQRSGSTTSVAEADCSDCTDCLDVWCYHWESVEDFLLEDGAESFLNLSYAQFVRFTNLDNIPFTWNRIVFEWTSDELSGDSALAVWRDPGDNRVLLVTPLSLADNPLVYAEAWTSDGFQFGLNSDDTAGLVTIGSIEVSGIDAMPLWTHGIAC